ncbi:hypothetical protein QE429_000557 [Bacillus sp. SORGH_AS 510]|uniref:hypothetical protein n=1 Tax=Bacillus sp. SORGH_AS_0510 TaxID=3041771 RepID=UPI002786D9BE|nr:hypothetical protein [Bacillus sp. SORGH_AS_0510]MDQ1143730.1 hypothetical protein [Bacillus sp. SORGH_AS_0510]
MALYVQKWHPRRPKVNLTSFNTNYVRVCNPFMPLWWAMAMPGAGHVMIGKKFKGFLLFVFEFLVNTQAHLNLSIYYSCTGKFELAKACLDTRWFFIYIGVYIFNAWDAYRLTTDINQFSMLAAREEPRIQAFNISMLEINYLQRINVWLPVFWSIVTPGLGHLIVRNVISGVYLIVWYIITIYQSKILEGIYHCVYGDFAQASAVMNIQWTIYLPSVFCFAACDSYYHAVEINELFKREQAQYLKKKYFGQKNKQNFIKQLETI